MAQKIKPPSSRGQLNIVLNGLVKQGAIAGYDVAVTGKTTTIEVRTEPGADQAIIVQRVRDVLPAAFSDAQVRTVAGS